MDSGRPASLARMSHRECDLICLLEGGRAAQVAIAESGAETFN